MIKQLFYRGRKFNISIAFILQYYFRALKDARLNSTHHVVMKIDNKKELKNIAKETAGNIHYKDFLKMYDYCANEPSRKGLKILTPQQMLTGLPISLAQIQAGKNSQKLKNEIRQLLY